MAYGLRRIIRNVASGPLCKSDGNASRMCSFAAFTSSELDPPAEPSSSTRNRYKKHLSLNGCSFATEKTLKTFENG